MKPFAAAFVDFKNVKTREVVQFIFEVPAKEAMAALEYLGGNPIAGKEKWAAIARFAPDSGGDRKERGRQGDTTGIAVTPSPPDTTKQAMQRCCIRCREEVFRSWIFDRAKARGMPIKMPITEDGERTDECVRLLKEILGIDSRAEIRRDGAAYRRWLNLESAFLQETGQIAEKRL